MKQRTHIQYERLNDHDFAFTIPKVTRPFGTPQEELDLIVKRMPRDVTVLVSGGVDAEVMAKYIAKTKNVTALCYRLYYGDRFINKHDVEWVKELNDVCDIEYEDFDVKHFWESNWFWEFVKTHKCTSPQLPLHAFMAFIESSIQFTVLPAIHPEPKHFKDTTWIQVREKDFSVVAALEGKKCLVSPLQSNSEILGAMLSQPEFKNFHTFGVTDGRARKSQQYFDYLGIETKPRPKYHGFEGSEDLDNGMRDRIFNMFGYSESHLYVPYKDMLDNLKADTTYSPSDKYLQILDTRSHHVFPATMK